jgi:pyruvate dehydrogenase E1 component alpha subunit
VGACSAISEEDYILPTHRGHGHDLAKGAHPDRLLAEIIGKESGYCKGRVGSMHIFDREHNNLGANGIVGSEFPIAVGIGLALKLKRSGQVLLCFFGDGSSNQGVFYEALNLASLWDLPIIFFCENNLYGMGTPYSRTSKAEVHRKGAPFGIPSYTADGNDVVEVYSRMKKIVAQVREKQKPALIECSTYRILGHSAFDRRPYRPEEELEQWKNRDPIPRLRGVLVDSGTNGKTLERIGDRVEARIQEAEQFALQSSYPEFDPSVER